MAPLGLALALVTATVDVRVRAIAAGGSGVGDLPDGRVVFVPRTAPGDRAAVRLEREKGRWAVGSLARLIEPAPDRSEPLCPLYARCGGCQLQHLPYAKQLEWKGRFVADALTRLGHLGAVEPPPVEPSPRVTGYRSRATFTLRRLRGGRVVAGFHALGHPARVVDVGGECVLPDPDIMDAWQELRSAWGPGARLLPSGGRLRLTLRASDAVDLLVEGGSEEWSSARLRAAAPSLRSVSHRVARSDRHREGEAFARDEPDTAPARFAFEQVNRAAAEALRDHVIDLVGPASAGATLVDAYCGDGAFGRRLAAAGWSVRGIELDRGAAAVASQGAPEGFTVDTGLVEDRLGSALPADVVLLNPPREGLHRDVVELLGRQPPESVVYVSCDPATLARDLGGLSARFAVEHVHAFDLFPQTAHVETVVGLRRQGGDA